MRKRKRNSRYSQSLSSPSASGEGVHISNIFGISSSGSSDGDYIMSVSIWG